jgi:integrase
MLLRCHSTSLLDDAARLNGTSDVPCPVWPVATHRGKLTAGRLVITFVPSGARTSAASLAISAGANPKVVQRMLGHASAAMTLDVYADLFDSDLDAVADRLDTLHRQARKAGR